MASEERGSYVDIDIGSFFSAIHCKFSSIFFIGMHFFCLDFFWKNEEQVKFDFFIDGED